MRVVGETDISGLKLPEARLGLDWAAEGLDLTSPNTASPHLYPDPCAFLLPKYTPKEPVRRALSHEATYTVSRYTLSQTHSPSADPITTTLSSHKDLTPPPPRHTHTASPQAHLYRQAQLSPTSLLPLRRYSPSIHPAFLRSRSREDPESQE